MMDSCSLQSVDTKLSCIFSFIKNSALVAGKSICILSCMDVNKVNKYTVRSFCAFYMSGAFILLSRYAFLRVTTSHMLFVSMCYALLSSLSRMNRVRNGYRKHGLNSYTNIQLCIVICYGLVTTLVYMCKFTHLTAFLLILDCIAMLVCLFQFIGNKCSSRHSDKKTPKKIVKPAIPKVCVLNKGIVEPTTPKVGVLNKVVVEPTTSEACVLNKGIVKPTTPKVCVLNKVVAEPTTPETCVLNKGIVKPTTPKVGVLNKVVVEPTTSEACVLNKGIVKPTTPKVCVLNKVVAEPTTPETCLFNKVVVEPATSETCVLNKVVAEPTTPETCLLNKVVVEPATSETCVLNKVVVKPTTSETCLLNKVVVEPATSETCVLNKVVVEPTTSEACVSKPNRDELEDDVFPFQSYEDLDVSPSDKEYLEVTESVTDQQTIPSKEALITSLTGLRKCVIRNHDVIEEAHKSCIESAVYLCNNIVSDIETGCNKIKELYGGCVDFVSVCNSQLGPGWFDPLKSLATEEMVVLRNVYLICSSEALRIMRHLDVVEIANDEEIYKSLPDVVCMAGWFREYALRSLNVIADSKERILSKACGAYRVVQQEALKAGYRDVFVLNIPKDESAGGIHLEQLEQDVDRSHISGVAVQEGSEGANHNQLLTKSKFVTSLDKFRQWVTEKVDGLDKARSKCNEMGIRPFRHLISGLETDIKHIYELSNGVFNLEELCGPLLGYNWLQDLKKSIGDDTIVLKHEVASFRAEAASIREYLDICEQVGDDGLEADMEAATVKVTEYLENTIDRSNSMNAVHNRMMATTEKLKASFEVVRKVAFEKGFRLVGSS